MNLALARNEAANRLVFPITNMEIQLCKLRNSSNLANPGRLSQLGGQFAIGVWQPIFRERLFTYSQ